MSRSPKYCAVRAGEERRLRLERERRVREQRRRREEAIRAKAALVITREAAFTRMAGVSFQSEETRNDVRRALNQASTVDDVSAAVRRLDEVSGMTEQLAQYAEQRRTAENRLTELEARLLGLVADADETDVPLEDLTLAREALEFIRSEADTAPPLEILELTGQLAGRLNDVERDLDAAIERISARREMLTSIVDALPTLGFSIDVGSLLERPDGSIGIQAHRRTGESLAVVVEDGHRDEHRVNYLRETGTGTAVLDRQACSELSGLAEQLNESVRGTGFEAAAVSWDGDQHDVTSSRRRRQPGISAERSERP